MRAVRSLAWIALLIVGALAIAGLVETLDHPASGDARPELTARDAAILAPRLAALQPSLQAMADEAQTLSAAGRAALAALRAGDPGGADDALGAGDTALDRLIAAAAIVRDARPGLLVDLGDGSRLSVTDRERLASVAAAVEGVPAIAGAWRDAGRAARLPVALVAAVADHAAAVERATDAGRDARYGAAAAAVGDAAIALETVRGVRDRIAEAGFQTATLDRLVARLADRDAALGTLYAALAARGGVRTASVEAALAMVEATTADLGDPAGALATAVGEAGASGIVDALLAIDDGRGAMDAALGDG